MGSPEAYFLAEWYCQDLADAPVRPTAARLDGAVADVSAGGTAIRLLGVIALPGDAMLFGVFIAASARVVAQVCERAGMSAQRITSAAGVHLRMC
ncbi:hypothetical protein K3U94_07215 [Mycolicibacter heraklionensis]|uniref:Uncharacterized protein n=1 Tax=Mycolicibacter heraklionensis TaxID=512402 RepID=A0A9X7WIS1_9MYCO|nr:hypothetical protein [Mycolicibacter heraklionensis]QZA09043.1 hypothetical protein K3U94_07215 [Mycolicibacter heraklionensis]